MPENLKVRLRNGFSDRNNIKPQNTEIQLRNFDERTRVQICNMLSRIFSYLNKCVDPEKEQTFLKYVLGEIYCAQIEASANYNEKKVFITMSRTIMEDDYDDVLTLLEAIVRYWDNCLKDIPQAGYYDKFNQKYVNGTLFDIVNDIFKEEYVGYRFIKGRISPISDEFEIGAVSDALRLPYKPVVDHLEKANILLSDRKSPDYENSIKESISAIEAMCEIITGVRGGNATLGNMLKKLEDNGLVIHGAMKSAFEKLYGYTSDANGIRHAGDIGGPSSTFEEAKFMLVSCSAFVNYLKAVSA